MLLKIKMMVELKKHQLLIKRIKMKKKTHLLLFMMEI